MFSAVFKRDQKEKALNDRTAVVVLFAIAKKLLLNGPADKMLFFFSLVFLQGKKGSLEQNKMPNTALYWIFDFGFGFGFDIISISNEKLLSTLQALDFVFFSFLHCLFKDINTCNNGYNLCSIDVRLQLNRKRK